MKLNVVLGRFLLLALLAPACSLFGQSDNFDDGDDAGWVRFNPLSVVGTSPTYSFPSNDVYHGRAYRIQSPAPPVPNAGPARAFTYRTNIYGDFFAAFDVVTFDASLNQAFGLLFRASNIGLGSTLGYVLNYDPQQASGGRGQIQINYVVNEAAPSGSTVGAANVTLDPNRRYRITLHAVGTEFTVHVYDMADLTKPVVRFQAADTRYPSGVNGLFNFYRGSSTTDPVAGRADSTFDNYFVTEITPTNVALPGTAHPLIGFPQVINRTPTTLSNFYAASGGLTFTATTLSEAALNTNGIRLILNGSDVTTTVQFSGTISNLQGSYTNLAANQVYDAQIVVTDSANRVYTNEFTFDTFSPTYLESLAVEVIEVEDYNYSGGQFQDNPMPSGLSTNGTQVNGNGVGYFDLPGTQEIDFFDRSSSPPVGPTSYRINDLVGTQSGSSELAFMGVTQAPINDTTRPKYATNGMAEYQVNRTEGGEWLNYTRVFSNGTYYVYLRAAGRSEQGVFLDKVTGDPTQTNQTTTSLGIFEVPNLHTTFNYRYIPLTDSNHNRVTVTLSGTNTLRLTMEGAPTNSTLNVMALNYLVFVPVPVVPGAIQLLSAGTVTGPYLPVAGATIDPSTGTITTPRPATNQFYRLSGTANRITSIQVVGSNLVLRY